jgi:tetratricopeptide (TPR) repeat protein
VESGRPSATSGRSATTTGRPGTASGRPGDTAFRDERRRTRLAEPPLPDDIDGTLLDDDITRELSTLSKLNADHVAKHLVAAGLALDEDPALALAHAAYAKSLAGRVGVVREALGVAAYHAGEYALSLTELRAARRITGDASQLPLMADCERALGRPDRALAVAKEPEAKRLDRAAQIELAIVCSGARRDLGQPDAAVLSLQGPELSTTTVQPWTLRLWYAYADALLAAGRRDEAIEWFGSAAAIDEDDDTDAAERLAELVDDGGQ